MKTPREKAAELIVNFQLNCKALNYEAAKQCALITVDEIMKAVGWEYLELGVDRDNYWQEVKTEITNL